MFMPVLCILWSDKRNFLAYIQMRLVIKTSLLETVRLEQRRLDTLLLKDYKQVLWNFTSIPRFNVLLWATFNVISSFSFHSCNYDTPPGFKVSISVVKENTWHSNKLDLTFSTSTNILIKTWAFYTIFSTPPFINFSSRKVSFLFEGKV